MYKIRTSRRFLRIRFWIRSTAEKGERVIQEEVTKGKSNKKTRPAEAKDDTWISSVRVKEKSKELGCINIEIKARKSIFLFWKKQISKHL